ncbi:hypothetical protein FRB90_003514, partial [Tulasnella sp. 427]
MDQFKNRDRDVSEVSDTTAECEESCSATEPTPAAAARSRRPVDLVAVDDDLNGRYWRTHYSLEIRRKQKCEASGDYRVVRKGINANEDYYEVLKWNRMFANQNPNTVRYWSKSGSFYESYPDCSEYYSRSKDYERYITPKCGGFHRAIFTKGRQLKNAPFYTSLVKERGLNGIRGPGHKFRPPWHTAKKTRKTRSSQ